MVEKTEEASVSEDKAEVVDHIQAGPVMVDGLGVGDVGSVVLRDRQILSEEGVSFKLIAILLKK